MEEQTNVVMDEEFGVDLSDIVTDEEPAGGNQTEAETEQEQPEEPAEQQTTTDPEAQEQTEKPEEASGNQTETVDGVKIKFLGQEEVVPTAEVPKWVQMGKNSERVQQKNAQLEAQIQEQAKWKAEQEANLSQLQALADATFGGDIGKTLNALRVNVKVHSGMSKEAAAQAVRNEDLQKQLDARNAREAAEAQAREAQNKAYQRQQEDINKFIAKYPNVNPKEIPQSVWEDVNNGNSLVNAYSHYQELAEQKKQNEKLAAEIAALKQNESNRLRAVGSATTSGGDTVGNDDFMKGFMSAL